MRTAVVVLSLSCCLAMPSRSQPTDPQMSDYLALLTRIAPAAAGGAQAYLHAFKSRCGREMTVTELRAAMAEANGEPVLMAMIRASHLQEAAAIDRLKARVLCTGRKPGA